MSRIQSGRVEIICGDTRMAASNFFKQAAADTYPYKVSTLNDEVSLYSVNLALLISLGNAILTMLASTELAEVLTSLGADVSPQLHLEPSDRGPAYGDIYTLTVTCSSIVIQYGVQEKHAELVIPDGSLHMHRQTPV